MATKAHYCVMQNHCTAFDWANNKFIPMLNTATTSNFMAVVRDEKSNRIRIYNWIWAVWNFFGHKEHFFKRTVVCLFIAFIFSYLPRQLLISHNFTCGNASPLKYISRTIVTIFKKEQCIVCVRCYLGCPKSRCVDAYPKNISSADTCEYNLMCAQPPNLPLSRGQKLFEWEMPRKKTNSKIRTFSTRVHTHIHASIYHLYTHMQCRGKRAKFDDIASENRFARLYCKGNSRCFGFLLFGRKKKLRELMYCSRSASFAPGSSGETLYIDYVSAKLLLLNILYTCVAYYANGNINDAGKFGRLRKENDKRFLHIVEHREHKQIAAALYCWTWLCVCVVCMFLQLG